MRSWIFQADPKRFDLDSFFEVVTEPFTWLVTRYATEIGVGDQVYIWRSGAGAGVVAEATVAEIPRLRISDPLSESYWTSQEDKGAAQVRALLRLVRTAGGKQVMRRDWFLEDPALRDMQILRMAAGTNFRLETSEAARLGRMWARVGVDWTAEESLAGLWAYVQTYDGEVSRLPGAPVQVVSNITGRAVSGVYNKVMNFRSIDPRESRAGMSGASATDRNVWARYFDERQMVLDVDAIRNDFARAWMRSYDDSEPLEAVRTKLEKEARRLETRSLDELLHAYRSALSHDPRPKPGRTPAKTAAVVFDRDPLVVAIARKRANESCEVPSCEHQTFLDDQGRRYLEAWRCTM